MTTKEIISSWIHESFLTREFAKGLRDWWFTVPSLPIYIPNFLRINRANCLGEFLSDDRSWTRRPSEKLSFEHPLHKIRISPNGLMAGRQYGNSAYMQIEPDILYEISPNYSNNLQLRRFYDIFLLCDDFANWFSACILTEPFTAHVLEWSRFEFGCDTPPNSGIPIGSVVRFEFNLDCSSEVTGGDLFFKNESDEITRINPRFAGLSIVPNRPGCLDWVTPWQAQRTGRFTASLYLRYADR